MKRLFDILLSVLLIFFLFPVFAITTFVLLLSEPGKSPLFFQYRVGRNGKLFSLIKFRTMTSSEIGNSTITTSNDARITKIGRFLRRNKIDELPALFNVLAGDMSVVGPRPDVPGYADRLIGEDRIILTLRPGITGPASLKYSDEELILSQVEDPIWHNDNVIWPDKVMINRDYANNNSLYKDIVIILKTIFKVYRR
jgi:lipopolysaccharide/colanic/teichoic acid biosynthesis glycosyltransferase